MDSAIGLSTMIAIGPDNFRQLLAGFHAMDTLRIEKAYRSWGHDIGETDTSLEAGLGFTHDYEKPGGFIGRDAALRQRESGLRRRLVVFALDDPEPLLSHNEPIWRDGALCGWITSAAYGHTVGRSIGMGYVAHPHGGVVTPEWVGTGRYELEIADVRTPARASLRAFYDPANERIRS
jgi:4-methylaminobutanoate oxidase (formaldehyde-forming)